MTEVSEYLAKFGGEQLSRLRQIQAIVAEEAPDAVESVSYGMLGWKLDGKPLLYAGGFAHHTGLYATPLGHEALAAEFAKYKQGKGSVQFPLSQPLPTDLIHKTVRIRVEQVRGA